MPQDDLHLCFYAIGQHAFVDVELGIVRSGIRVWANTKTAASTTTIRVVLIMNLLLSCLV